MDKYGPKSVVYFTTHVTGRQNNAGRIPVLILFKYF